MCNVWVSTNHMAYAKYFLFVCDMKQYISLIFNTQYKPFLNMYLNKKKDITSLKLLTGLTALVLLLK